MADEKTEAMREVLKQHVRLIAQVIADTVPKGTGFALVMFDYGEKGSMAYASNGDRAQMIAMYEELLSKLKNEEKS